MNKVSRFIHWYGDNFTWIVWILLDIIATAALIIIIVAMNNVGAGA